jgi:hypothetical protein
MIYSDTATVSSLSRLGQAVQLPGSVLRVRNKKSPQCSDQDGDYMTFFGYIGN